MEPEKKILEKEVKCAYLLCLKRVSPGLRMQDEKGKIYCSQDCIIEQANFLGKPITAQPVHLEYRR
jgi:hypothetical protein